ncbi:hypothetical protein [Streptomyces globisporus]|uniref:hypothetical protein n=1 Tax=Streptomyces globisporus TaxID=1908 RepID=UPI003797B7B8
MELLADLGLAVLLSTLEAMGLAALWFIEGLKRWAAKGHSVPDPTGRHMLVLSTGSACSAVIAYGLFCADLPIAGMAQAVLAALLALLLLLVSGAAWGRRLGRDRRRRRLRRERLRWHESQREGSTSASALLRRRRRRP